MCSNLSFCYYDFIFVYIFIAQNHKCLSDIDINSQDVCVARLYSSVILTLSKKRRVTFGFIVIFFLWQCRDPRVCASYGQSRWQREANIWPVNHL